MMGFPERCAFRWDAEENDKCLSAMRRVMAGKGGDALSAPLHR